MLKQVLINVRRSMSLSSRVGSRLSEYVTELRFDDPLKNDTISTYRVIDCNGKGKF